jgi:hypothetical protein
MVIVVAGATLLAGCTGPVEAERPSACQASLQAGEAKVRTERWDPPAELPDLGEYAEIHWQVRAAGEPCGRAPGPTDWLYQGVVQLRPVDAQKLAAQYEWSAVAASPDPNDLDGPAQMWDALKPFVPAGRRSRRSGGGGSTSIPTARWPGLRCTTTEHCKH